MNTSNITKFNIIKKSGSLARAIISSILFTVTLSACLFLLMLRLNWIAEIITAVLMCLAIYLFAAFVTNLIIIVQIAKGKYRVETSVVHLIRRSNKYRSGYDNKKALVLDDVSIIVDETKSAQFRRGDEIVLVYLNGKEYPIVIEKKRSFLKNITCDQ